jgi:hypothetical protein
MIVCPACRHAEMAGALFCSECGARLSQSGALDFPIFPAHEKPIAILYLVDGEEKLPVFDTQEVILGRASPGHPTQPDIDLAPYGAYDAGVSRQHALLEFAPQLQVTDLGSANGTAINDRVIPARQPFPLHPADILTLGSLRIQVLIQK